MFAWWRLRRLDPELALAQYVEFRRQISLLYLLLGVNTAALAYTHVRLAPSWIAIWVPGVLIAVIFARMAIWHFRPVHGVSAEQATAFLRRITVLSFLIAASFITWSLTLSGFGGEQEQAHTAIYIAITVIGCIFCLFPLPQAAVTTTVTVTVPYLVHCLMLDEPVYAAIAVNILLVTLVMMRVLFKHHGSFTELVRLNRTVTALARTDPLTGLPNRRHFFAELEARLAAPNEAGRLVVGILDLDRFKVVNDTYGHAAGDRLLRLASARLGDVLTDECLVCRLGGDEFAFLAALDVESARALADRTCRALAKPFTFDGVTVSIGASCGLAQRGEHLAEASALYAAADYALYVGKSDRRGLVSIYSSEYAQRLRTERALEAALQAADLDAELDVVVQPIVAGPAGPAIAVEALARWTSPMAGPVSPAVFIPLAERTGLIHRMTLTLFAKALRHAERLPPGVRLSFNLSAHDLASSETMVGLLAMIRRSSIRPRHLILEITETALMRDFEAAQASVIMLRAAGVRIALDDFGTGYSNLEYLRRLPIDKIKIDRSFVADMRKPGGSDLLAGIVALCDRMGKTCIAEGVEGEDQFAALWKLGCRSFQGYHFARPMPFEDFLEWNARLSDVRADAKAS